MITNRRSSLPDAARPQGASKPAAGLATLRRYGRSALRRRRASTAQRPVRRTRSRGTDSPRAVDDPDPGHESAKHEDSTISAETAAKWSHLPAADECVVWERRSLWATPATLGVWGFWYVPPLVFFICS